MTSPTIPRTPAFLQPYLESDGDLPGLIADSDATPKAEKSRDQCEVRDEPPKGTQSKTEAPKIQPPPSDIELPKPTKNVPSEPNTAISVQASPRPGLPKTLIQETQYKDLHQPAPKHPIPSSLALVPEQSNPTHAYPYGNIVPGQPTFQSPQMTYLQVPPQPDPSTIHQPLGPQGVLYYSDYGPPPPVPEIPYQLQHTQGDESRLANENPMALLHRVRCVLPDLSALLDSYQDIHSILESREIQIQNMEYQRTTEKQEQENRFAKLESMLKKHSTESNQLRLDISSVDKKCKALQDRLKTEEKTNDTLEATNESLRKEKRQMVTKHEEDKAIMTQQHSLDKDRMAAEHKAKQRVSHDELMAQIRKAEASLSLKEAHLSRAHEEEKQRLETAWTKQRRELEDRHAKLLMDLEDKLEAKQKVVDEERHTYLQARDGWDRERDGMMRRWEEERAIIRKTSEEQNKALMTKHEREKNDILKQVSQAQQRNDKEDSIHKMQREVEALRSGWEADKFRFQRTTADFKSTARTLNEQNSKLQRLTEALGDAVDVRGK